MKLDGKTFTFLSRIATLVVRIPLIGVPLVNYGAKLLGVKQGNPASTRTGEPRLGSSSENRLREFEIRLEALEILTSNFKDSSPEALRKLQREINELRSLLISSHNNKDV